MYIGSKKDRSRDDYYMEQENDRRKIESCDQEKDLGVTFDEKLEFNKHI